MSSATFPLTGEQKNRLHELVGAPVSGAPLADLKNNPHLRIFAVHFDGTQNDREAVPAGYQATLVSKSYETLLEADDPRMVSHYINGVATRTSGVRRVLEATTGIGCEERAEAAHRALSDQANAWLKEDPQAQVHVHAVGFSRGAATALHFMNLVDQRGALPQGLHGPSASINFVPGNVLSSAVLYDTVATGQQTTLDLTVPKTSMAVLHLVAGGEERVLFPVQAIADTSNAEMCAVVPRDPETKTVNGEMRFYQRVHELNMPGARHSDVGGSYVDGNLREVSDYLASAFQASLGLPVEPVNPTFESIQEARFHDSRFLKISDDPGDRQRAADRLTVGRPDASDKSQYLIDLKVSGLASPGGSGNSPAEQSFTRFGRVDDSEQGATLKGLFDEDLKVSIKLLGQDAPFTPGDPFAKYDLDFKCNADSVIQPDSDGFLRLCDKRLPGLPSLAEMAGRLKERQANGIDSSIDLQVLPKNFGGLCEVTRVPNAELPACPMPLRDPWPAGIREQIMLINEKPKLNQREASICLNAALFAAGKALQEEGIADGDVRISAKRITERTENGVRRRNAFDIQCDSSGEVVGNLVPATTLAHQKHHQRAMEISAALEALGTSLRERGFRPRDMNRFLIGKDDSQPTVDLASAEPVVQGNESSATMGADMPMDMGWSSPATMPPSGPRDVWKIGSVSPEADAEAGISDTSLYDRANTAVQAEVKQPNVGNYLFGTLGRDDSVKIKMPQLRR